MSTSEAVYILVKSKNDGRPNREQHREDASEWLYDADSRLVHHALVFH